jgi:hypothetical protein
MRLINLLIIDVQILGKELKVQLRPLQEVIKKRPGHCPLKERACSNTNFSTSILFNGNY